MSLASPRSEPEPSKRLPGKRLIVTADDFGIDVAVNEAVEQAYTQGILTCASLMMGAPATADAVARAHRLKGLAVGLHITLAEGDPVSPRSHVRGLIDSAGHFRNDLVRVGFSWAFNPLVRLQLAHEIKSQFEAFIATGLVLDHVNVHKHLHLHPTVSSLVIHIGRRYGMLAIRVPDEPAGILRKADPTLKPTRNSLAPVQYVLRRRARRAHLIQNDQVFGLAWSGHMTEERLLALIPHLPPGLNELYTHPATADGSDMPHAAPGYQYREELQALLSPRVRQAIIENEIVLTRFASAPSVVVALTAQA